MRAFAPAAVALLAAMSGVAAPAGAAEDARIESAGNCARIEADAERLRCYDGVFGRGRAPAGKAETAAQPAQAGTAAPATAAAAASEADFGLTPAQRQAGKPEPAKPAEPEEIRSRIAKVIPRGMEPPLLELENGQQWLLLESMGSYRFRAGDAIAIRRGSLGSYLASNPDRKGAWRVRRVK